MLEPDYRNMDPATAYPRALDAMRNPAFLKTARYQEQQGRANVVGAHPHIVEFARKLVKRGAQLGIPLFPHCIVRTYEEQASAFVRGVSNDSPEDGLWPHKFGAVDIIHGTLGWKGVDAIPHGWDVLVHLGFEVANSMDLKVVSGSTFKRPWDPAHWELANWREIAVTGDRWWSPESRV